MDGISLRDERAVVNGEIRRRSALSRLVGLLLACAAVAGLAVACWSLVIGDPAASWRRARAELVERGLARRPHEFGDVYAALGGSLPAAVELRPLVYDNLLVLQRRPCDGPAVLAAATDAFKAGERAWAARAFELFGTRCPTLGVELRLAAERYIEMGQLGRAEAITARLVADYPTKAAYWYVHARVLYQKREDLAAIEAYKNVVRFHGGSGSIGAWVWSELANLYGRNGVPCSSEMLRAGPDIDRNLCQAGLTLRQRAVPPVPQAAPATTIRM